MGVRFAGGSDLLFLKQIEDAADRLYLDLFGDVDWPEGSDGRWRATLPGFLLVTGDPPYGFAHVLEIEGEAHLEQLAVLPRRQRQGAGTALLRAAMAEATARGYASLSLRTYLEVPWNAPFYAAHGFEVVDPVSEFQRSLVERERGMHLMEHGTRVLMRAPLAPPGSDAASGG